MPSDPCPDRGAPRGDGLCPRCLVKLGIDEPGRAPDQPGETLDLRSRPGSVLETLDAMSGDVPRVLLRGTVLGDPPSGLVSPMDGPDAGIRYRIDGRIARGGMGTVLKGHDPDLGRDVAIKVLREDHRDDGDMVRRFVEEAQIAGQLQHPGIVPIHEIGTFPDGRPFICIKLVRGQTLGSLLASRPSLAEDLPRFLTIYEAIAQTMAYAHSRGVIHRDLKPSNVMVGPFGEVQVMDWGLAKVLAGGSLVDDARVGKGLLAETAIATARSGSGDDLSRAGSVMGTPSSMAPEQARGEVDWVDQRADVFALGSILGEILTGAPAFTGRTPDEIIRKAARGDTADVLKRLGGCGADAELIALARDCLAVEPEGRPHDAKVVADRITAYLAGVQERVEAADRHLAVSAVRMREERRYRGLQAFLAALVLVLPFGRVGWNIAARLAQKLRPPEATGQEVLSRVIALQHKALEHADVIEPWEAALYATQYVEPHIGSEARARLVDLRATIEAGLDAARGDRKLLDRPGEIRTGQGDDDDGGRTDADYARTFADAGLDLSKPTPAEVGRAIKARPPSVAVALAAMLDDWAAVRRGRRNNAVGANLLTEVARVADPDPWRNELRETLALASGDGRKQRLNALASSAKFEEMGVVTLNLLGSALADERDLATAERVLRRALARHSGDAMVNHRLAVVLGRLDRRDDAIRFYTAARAFRPETAHEFAHALADRGQSDEAIEVFQDLVRLRPRIGRHLACLESALLERGRPKDAAPAFERAVPDCREATRLNPE